MPCYRGAASPPLAFNRTAEGSSSHLMPIRLLPPDVSAKIAAGEVIERPASVVKELVENSLDAEATEISIEARGGGADFLRVADNGTGIAGDEVELAFQRFATSKLSGPADLDAISSLGFRGEALPSIAAVSKISLATRIAAEEWGTSIEAASGELQSSQRHGAAPGTVVTVRHLFRGYPARRKFLRTPATESTRIQTLATRYALAYPHVRMQLVLEGKNVFATSGSGELREAVGDLYSPQMAGEMLTLSDSPEYQEERLAVPSGLIGPPSVSRSNRNHISIFVNGRWVQNRTLVYALEEAYRGFLKERRFPVAVVNLAVPFEEVDVNVHPAKAEVRFRREGPAFTALQRAVRQTLTLHSPIPQIQQPLAPPPHIALLSGGGGQRPDSSTEPGLQDTAAASPREGDPHTPSEAPGTQSQSPSLVPQKALPALRILGQVQSTYIAAEGPDGIYLIDQHAAHERIVFERVMAESAARSSHVQTLLEPATVDLDPRQRELVESRVDLLKSVGFQIEPFGGPTYLLRGVPGLLTGGDPGQAFIEVLDLIADGGGFDSWGERAAYSVACHGAIRAGMTLSDREMSELARQLEECQQPHTCPHGRPTIVHMSSARLEREFGRR